MRLRIVEPIDLPTHKVAPGVFAFPPDLAALLLATGKVERVIEDMTQPPAPETHDATKPRRIHRKGKRK